MKATRRAAPLTGAAPEEIDMKEKLNRARHKAYCSTCDKIIWMGSLFCKRTGECARCWLDRLCAKRHAHKVTNVTTTHTRDVVE